MVTSDSGIPRHSRAMNQLPTKCAATPLPLKKQGLTVAGSTISTRSGHCAAITPHEGAVTPLNATLSGLANCVMACSQLYSARK
jgi:hypothetical protein